MADQDGNLDNAKIVQAPPFNFTKYTTWGAAIGALGAAVLAIVQSFNGVDPVIVDGALAVVAVGLLAIALVTATDVACRAYATAAKLKASPPSVLSPKKASDAADSALKANGANTLATIVAPFTVQVHGRRNESFSVLAIRCDADAKATYLVARQNEQPIWVKENEVEATLSLPK